MLTNNDVSNNARAAIAFTLEFSTPTVTTRDNQFVINGNYTPAPATDDNFINGGGACRTLGALTGFEFYMSSGNILTGAFDIYGYSK